MDLSNASSLCQESEDLIELQERDRKTLNNSNVALYKTLTGCLRKNQTRLLIPGVEVKQKATIYMMCATTTRCNYRVWSLETVKPMWDDELQLL